MFRDSRPAKRSVFLSYVILCVGAAGFAAYASFFFADSARRRGAGSAGAPAVTASTLAYRERVRIKAARLAETARLRDHTETSIPAGNLEAPLEALFRCVQRARITHAPKTCSEALSPGLRARWDELAPGSTRSPDIPRHVYLEEAFLVDVQGDSDERRSYFIHSRYYADHRMTPKGPRPMKRPNIPDFREIWTFARRDGGNWVVEDILPNAGLRALEALETSVENRNAPAPGKVRGRRDEVACET